MAYSWTDIQCGMTPVTTVDDEQKFPIGTRRRAYDPSYGEGEFIYLPGAASTVAGDAVVYDTDIGATAQAFAASRGPIAIAMAATGAGTWGWYQIHGAAVINCPGAVSAGAPLYLTATAGQLDDATAAGQGIDGAVCRTAAAGAGTFVAQISYPSASGAF